MYIVLLKFSANRAKAGSLMEDHKAWIARGRADGVFLLVGSIAQQQGGAILVQGLGRDALEARLREDPFVVEDVVSAEIIEIAPALADERLQFLLDDAA